MIPETAQSPLLFHFFLLKEAGSRGCPWEEKRGGQLVLKGGGLGAVCPGTETWGRGWDAGVLLQTVLSSKSEYSTGEYLVGFP